jgi:hypothetical protein
MRAVVLLALCACWSEETPIAADVGSPEAGMPAVDASLPDAAPVDAGERLDASLSDAGAMEAADTGSSPSDAGPDCSSLPPGYAKQICLKPWIQSLTRNEGPEHALCAAEDLLESGAVTDCHLLAHFVGEVVYEQQGGDAAQALTACPATCLSGCGHQVMQEVVEAEDLNRLFREQGEDAVTAALRRFVGICESYRRDDLDRFSLCIHGVGHGLTSSGFLGPEEAADLCIAELGLDGYACASGVFMEYTSRYIRLSEEQLVPSIPTICSSLGLDWRDLCWRNVGESLMWFFGHALERVLSECGRIADPDSQKACEEGAELEAQVAEMQRGTCP